MRTFIAIFPPDELLQEFKKIQGVIKSKFPTYLRSVKPEHLHVSLRFLGELEEDKGKLLTNELADNLSSIKSFNVRLHEVTFGFRNQRYPRILFVSVMKSTGFSRLSKAIDTSIKNALTNKAFEELKTRETIYHITLARTKKRVSLRVIKNIRHFLTKISLWEGFRVDKIKLMKSELSREGPTYTTLATFPLL